MKIEFSAFRALCVAAIAAAFAICSTPSHAACPTNAGQTLACGSYTISNYSVNKLKVKNVGGSNNTTWMAIGMLETDTMSSNYTYGDGKSGDSANFGFLKMNWWMLRTGTSDFAGQSSGQWNNGASLNGNYSKTMSCANKSVSHFGWTNFWNVHRGGQSRLNNWTPDTNQYYVGVQWIQNQINANYAANSTNNTRFWVSVPAI